MKLWIKNFINISFSLGFNKVVQGLCSTWNVLGSISNIEKKSLKTASLKYRQKCTK